ncbi:DUF7312 domain-containing protein [Halobaculum limi]|uniref:DUF7312 domain-containing protein n=1 Tax=Halobaculum limi TaxID=3031916 RepID=UPI002404B351|nr:hypothetical protein [Halobaculum sp. YSMS11]
MADDSRVDADAATPDDDDQWRFGLDEVGPEAEAANQPAPIEPESISAENALFVVTGVLGTLLLVFSVTL